MYSLKGVYVLFILTLLGGSGSGQANSTYAWKTFTGMAGGWGNSDGASETARFNYPYGVAVDRHGNLYVADTYNNTIRKVTKSGLVTTIAGSAGEIGSVDGPGGEARFSSPSCVAVDGADNLYVTDTYNNTIRKITSDGMVTTIAGGAGQVGSADGTNGAARFREPYGIAVDNAGSLYVTDAGNSTLRKISSSGVVTTIAGTPGESGNSDGTNQEAQFYYPAGLALDNAGNIYIADLNNSTIRKVTSDGVVTTLAGTAEEAGSADGTNGTAQFYFPSSVAVDNSANVFVVDTFNSTIRKVTSTGVVTTLAGSAEQFGSADGTNGAAQFYYPSGIAVDSSGNLYVADTDNSTIRKVTSAGVVTTLAGSVEHAGTEEADGTVARFDAPYGIALDSAGNAYVADTLNNTIRKVTSSGLVSTLAGSPEQAGSTDAAGDAARFDRPYAIAASGGNLYVADTFNKTIRKVTPLGEVTTLAGSAGQSGNADGTNGAARFDSPIGIAADSAGNLYVTDFLGSTIRKVASNGVVTTLAGSPGQSGSEDGTNSAARFSGPFGVGTDHMGNVYVTDSASHTIRKVTSDGVVTTLAGSAGQSGGTDGTNSVARFNNPAGIAVDSLGNLYVADIGNATIRKVTSAGVVMTLAGSAGQVGSLNGIGSAARFFAPAGVAVDSAGHLRVTDSGNHTIRKVTSDGVVTTLAGRAEESGSIDVAANRARFYRPVGVAVDGIGNLYVADTYNNSIRKVAGDRGVTTLAGLPGHFGSANGTGSSARFAYPFGLAADTAGNVYVADSYNSTIRKVTSEGVTTTLAGSAGNPGTQDGIGSAAQFSYPSGVGLDASGNLFVADFDSSTLRKVTSNGTVITLAGNPGQPGSADGTGSDARFDNPNGVALDNAGNVYVADSGNSTIRKVTSDGVVTTLAGSAGQPGSLDGSGSAARFDYPFGVAVDSAGNIYVADAGNSTIRRITSDGIVTTIGGYPGVIGGEDGIGSAAGFSGPCGIAVDVNGRLYVADSGNNRISRGVQLPALRIVSSGTGVMMSWPSPSGSFALQQNSDVNNSNSWVVSSYSFSDDGTNKRVMIVPPHGNQFFRLISTD